MVDSVRGWAGELKVVADVPSIDVEQSSGTALEDECLCGPVPQLIAVAQSANFLSAA